MTYGTPNWAVQYCDLIRTLLCKPLLFLFFCGLYLPNSSFANAPVRFVTEHWPPYNYLDQNGQLQGMATEKVLQTLGNLSIEADIEVFHWAKAIQLAEHEQNVFIFSIYRTQEREDRFQWICPLIETDPVAFYKLKSRQDISLDSVQDAKNYHTSVMRSDLTMAMLEQAGFEEGIHFSAVHDEMTNVRKLIHGRIDLIVQEENALQYRLQQLGAKREDLVRLEPLELEKMRMCCIATSLNSDPMLVEKIRAELKNVGRVYSY